MTELKVKCRHCGKEVSYKADSFFDGRLIHMRREHPYEFIGLGWSTLQRVFVR